MAAINTNQQNLLFTYVTKFVELTSLGIAAELHVKNMHGELTVSMETKFKTTPYSPKPPKNKPSQARRRKRQEEARKMEASTSSFKHDTNPKSDFRDRRPTVENSSLSD